MRDYDTELEYMFDSVIQATDKYGVNTPELDKALDDSKAKLSTLLQRVERETRNQDYEEFIGLTKPMITQPSNMIEHFEARINALKGGEK